MVPSDPLWEQPPGEGYPHAAHSDGPGCLGAGGDRGLAGGVEERLAPGWGLWWGWTLADSATPPLQF